MTREEAIDEIKRWTPILLMSGQCTEKTSKTQDMAISVLSENTREWIPVSERLPEKNRAVLTYVDTGMTKTYRLAYWNDRVNGWEEWIGYRMLETEMGYKVLAWQPLPEPYNAERGET